tara:strand:+ start:6749 stop:7030 length:282 start_codon:yes stop_codon:yes gene_type:complete
LSINGRIRNRGTVARPKYKISVLSLAILSTSLLSKYIQEKVSNDTKGRAIIIAAKTVLFLDISVATTIIIDVINSFIIYWVMGYYNKNVLLLS